MPIEYRFSQLEDTLTFKVATRRYGSSRAVREIDLRIKRNNLTEIVCVSWTRTWNKVESPSPIKRPGTYEPARFSRWQWPVAGGLSHGASSFMLTCDLLVKCQAIVQPRNSSVDVLLFAINRERIGEETGRRQSVPFERIAFLPFALLS